MYSNWANAAMALHRLEGFEDRMKETVKRSAGLFASLNQMEGIKVIELDNGTNICILELAKEIDGKKFRDKLRDTYNIRIGMPNAKKQVFLVVNESLVNRDTAALVEAFKDALRSA